MGIPTPMEVQQARAAAVEQEKAVEPNQDYLNEFQAARTKGSDTEVWVYVRPARQGRGLSSFEDPTLDVRAARALIERAGWRLLRPKPTQIRDGSWYEVWGPHDAKCMGVPGE